MTAPAVVRNSFAHSVSSALYHTSPSHHYKAVLQQNLDGYAFNCNSLVVGFTKGHLYCQGAHGGDTFTCGEYEWRSNKLTGILSDSSFVASNLVQWDGLLLGFNLMDDTPCHVVSLNYQDYSVDQYLGLECAHFHTHYSLGASGDVAVRSPKLFGNTKIVRDYYGVFQFDSSRDRIKFYFGPQPGRLETTVLDGTLSTDGNAIYIEQMGACVHDGQSTTRTLKELEEQKPNNHDSKQQQQQHAFAKLQGLFQNLGRHLLRWKLLRRAWHATREIQTWCMRIVSFGSSDESSLWPALGLTVTALITKLLAHRPTPPKLKMSHPSILDSPIAEEID